MDNVLRRDFKVSTVDGVNIAIREVRPAAPPASARTPIVLLHGTRIPGASEYDLPVPNGSFAADLARRGHVCFIPDARGYGGSDRPEAMSRPPEESRPLARSIEITRDVDAAVDALRAATGAERVALMGWGVGATILVMYASLWPEKVSHIILYNAIYGGGTEFPRYRNATLEDPDRPGRFNVARYGGYAYNKLDMLLHKWDESIPIDDKDAWRDPAVAKAFEQALIDGDPTSRTRDPVTFRSPNGMLEDSFYIGRGQKLVHACQVQCRVLIIRPELDYFSRPEDVAALKEDLVNAEEVQVWEPANTTHYLILDRPERGRTAALDTVSGFIG
ncbi:MAG: alpha/beta hydrolase [Beijerinckiaceae bacterium]|nr:alpha/beta hydrolase [Beijerinckiaceae bacterium]